MLRLAVKRNRHATIRSDVRQKLGSRLGSSQASDDLPSYVICDSKAKGVIRHASKGFQDLLGDCDGRQLVCPATLLQSHVLKEISNQAGLSSEEVASSIHRMARAAEEAVQRTATGPAPPVPVLLSHSSGELFTCQISWRKNVHPTLGWSYYTGLVQNISEDISAGRLLVAACKDSTYAELCSEWAEASRVDGELLTKLGASEELHAAAQKMWKDELAKGVKPHSASKRREADMSSIWSRSTASTITSSKDSKENKQAKADERAFGSHHFGALLGMLPSSSEDSDKPMEEERPQLPTGEAFQSASEDDFEECETMSESSSLSIDSGPPLFDQIADPVKHVDRPRLRQMKQAFVLATSVHQVNHATTTDMDDCGSQPTGKILDFPIALRSFGLEESGRNWPSGPAWKAKSGSNAREVFQPGPSSGPQAPGLWRSFCESFERQEFFKDETGSGKALLGNLKLALPAGELAFVQSFHGRLGNPIECLVYVKHVELDDCPFLLALHSYLPNDDYSLEDEFYKLSSELDAVISELASEFFYFSPMRRQRTFRSTRIDQM